MKAVETLIGAGAALLGSLSGAFRADSRDSLVTHRLPQGEGGGSAEVGEWGKAKLGELLPGI